ncbi:hypothetical protein [Leptotrichia trevisanii]|uniref:hypothetical protein n=1 Tax=Leptotrichia trevisanii TaxID=109328 RepID=UPI0026F02CA1|nr:hypothetical protein [Leptotrichia trevisanii]
MNASKYQARYVEGVYGDFLKGIKDSGYLTDGEIVDLMKASMTDGDKARLNGYGLGDMQYRIFLDASSDITDEDREKIIKYLEELTGYDLELKKDISNKYKKECDEGNANKCGYEIDFVKDAKGNKKELSDSAKKYVKSNKLVDELIKTPKKVFITNEKDNNRTEKFGTDRSGSHAYGNKEHKCIRINCITNNYSLDFRVSHGILIDFGISPEEEAKVNRTRQEMEKKR